MFFLDFFDSGVFLTIWLWCLSQNTFTGHRDRERANQEFIFLIKSNKDTIMLIYSVLSSTYKPSSSLTSQR